MNKIEADILQYISRHGSSNQRTLARECDCSLGRVNQTIQGLKEKGYLNNKMLLSMKAKRFLAENKPCNAIILAAGAGMRMVPIHQEISKGLLEVHGETLIERLIHQLHEVGVKDIYVVTGFMKEQYEYLIDEYGVNLLVNQDYASSNNILSLFKAKEFLGNSYIIPCDIWCRKNPFSTHEGYSWYLLKKCTNAGHQISLSRNQEIRFIAGKEKLFRMVGIAYFNLQNSARLVENIEVLLQNEQNKGKFWESALFGETQIALYGKVWEEEDAIEIDTYEQLRELDEYSNHLRNDAIDVIEQALDIPRKDIREISILKKGMTNRSFLFACREKRYIMRIPGEGSEKLVDRKGEAVVYQTLEGKEICDPVIYINAENGYKITHYYEKARTCNPFNRQEVAACLRRLKQMHRQKLQVDREFCLFEQIEKYEALWDDIPSIFRDYRQTKEKVFSLRSYIEEHIGQKVLCHIDSVPDNFLFVENEQGEEEIRLIDWEYAGMQDPHVDIAMFCIYAMYDREWIDFAIKEYLQEEYKEELRIKIYAYIAVCGLLWSNWCEYKRSLGVEFGEYSLKQYRYAKEYYHLVMEEREKNEQ